MSSIAADIKDLLDSESSADYRFAVNMFISSMPEKPDACICLFDTGGYPPAVGYNYQKLNLMIHIRGAIGDYENAYNKANNIKNLLHESHNESWGNSWYIGVWAVDEIFFLGRDEKNRPLFSINFEIHRTT